jgi:hypothetical protein
MTRDQLVKVFPDGRTVHIPTDGVPLKGYELAKAEIERRGNGDDAATIGKPSFFAALFKSGKSSDEDEDAASVSVVNDSRAPAVVAAATSKPAEIKSTESVPAPRARPQNAGLQLAAADSGVVQPARPKLQTTNDQAEARPQTPADIINARGFWGEDAAAAKQAAPAQAIAAFSARRALESADPQPTAPTSAAYRALAYASSPPDRSDVVTASAPIPHLSRPVMQARDNLVAASGINTVAAKGVQGESGPVANSARIGPANLDGAWLRIIMLSPSVGASMSVTVLGDTDLTLMRAFFVKPQAVINIGFGNDPMMGMSCDHFSGSATLRLEMMWFMLHTAALR